ncbi:MAG: hypothetical protein JSW73_02930 [Candidatus Woesearchaeota archaeon]|nr:MAG: hypothetical protein JSW73_02930 [Candidatus Woesearchaeota archaeon]
MKFRQLSTKDSEDILKLEEEMYWLGKKWHTLWKEEGEQKFRESINDYLTNFPSGCFGLFDEREQLLGAIIFTKLSTIKTIPYIHRFDDYFEKEGGIAYVQIFVIKDNSNELAERMYRQANKIAKNINCNRISVVIYSSPVEESILKKLGYTIEQDNLKWEIYLNKFVDCKIYTIEVKNG